MTMQPSKPHLQPVPQGHLNDRGGKAQPMLIVQNLKKYFPIHGGMLNRKVAEVKAVDDVSFTVMKGETPESSANPAAENRRLRDC